jgi:hypothetical protein
MILYFSHRIHQVNSKSIPISKTKTNWFKLSKTKKAYGMILVVIVINNQLRNKSTNNNHRNNKILNRQMQISNQQVNKIP